MTNETNKKEFDCVRTMREIRDRISAEIAGKTPEELAKWFNAHRYSDPVLQKLCEPTKGEGIWWSRTVDDHIERKREGN